MVSRRANRRHHHVEMDEQVQALRYSRRRTAWQEIARLSLAAPAARWRVVACLGDCRRVSL